MTLKAIYHAARFWHRFNYRRDEQAAYALLSEHPEAMRYMGSGEAASHIAAAKRCGFSVLRAAKAFKEMFPEDRMPLSSRIIAELMEQDS